MQNRFARQNLWLIIGFVLLWNSGFIGAEFGLPYAGPFTILFWRYLALTLVLIVYLRLTKKISWIGWRYAGSEMLIGALAHGGWLACVLIAIDYGVPAGIVALVVALQPMLTGALSGMVVGEPTPFIRWLGLIIGFVGVMVPIITRVDFQVTSDVVAWFIPLLAVIAITIASLIERRIDLKKDYPHIPISLSLFYQSLATTVVAFFPALFGEHLSTQWNPVFISSMIWLVLAVSMGAYAFMWLLVFRIDATRVASLFYLGPPVTMLMAWIAFGDQVEAIDFIGMAIVLFGVLLGYLKMPAKGNRLIFR